MNSIFDPQAFLELEVDGEMATQYAPVPLGRYEMKIANPPKTKLVQPGPGDDYEAFVTFEADCEISGDVLTSDGRKLKDITGKDRNFARYKCQIETTGPNGTGGLALGTGKNVGLGRLRKATGQLETPRWKMAMLVNARFSGEIKHKVDKNDSSKVYAEVINPLPL